MTTFSRFAAALTTSFAFAFALASAAPAFATPADPKADKPGSAPYSCEAKPGEQPKRDLTPAEARAAARGVKPPAPLACNDDRKSKEDVKPRFNPNVKPGAPAKNPGLKP